MRAAIRFALVVSALLSVVRAWAGQPDDLQARIAAQLTDLQQQGGYPGVTVGIAMPDGRVLTAAAGWADRTRQIPLKPSDRMPAGSVGKTFVAAAILQAVDAGSLSLDEPIARWLGAEPWFARVPNAPHLTLRLLLSHRSGLPEPYENGAFFRAIKTDVDKQWQPHELIAFVLGSKPRSAAGSKYFYSDMNYVIAGAAFERATGQPLFGAIRTGLLDRFALDETATSESRNLQDVVPGVLDKHDGLGRSGESISGGRFVYNLQAEYAGGGIISTSRDLARWGKILWEGGAFSSARLAEMLDAKPSEKDTRYGFATEIIQSGAGPLYGHDGTIFGYLAQVIYIPKYKLAAAIQINSDPVKFKVSPGQCLSQIVTTAVREICDAKDR